jgi:chitin disaccharide deacetylase
MGASGTKRVIINADDFGFSGGISEGILRAHREGVVTSTTIAANMPAAEEAVRQLKDVPRLGVGVHLNACQGPPLSKEGIRLAGVDGVMRLTATQLLLKCVAKPWLVRVIEAEFDAQIRWVLDHGIQPTHLDSHRHIHGYPPVFARVARLARRYNIRFVRWHREAISDNCGAPLTAPSGASQLLVARTLNALGWINARMARDLIATNGTWGVARTGAITAEWLIGLAGHIGAGVTEIMTHPGLADGLDASASRLRESRERELAALCDPAVRDAFQKNGIELVHYGQLPG